MFETIWSSCTQHKNLPNFSLVVSGTYRPLPGGFEICSTPQNENELIILACGFLKCLETLEMFYHSD